VIITGKSNIFFLEKTKGVMKKMDNAEKEKRQYRRRKTNQKPNTICVENHYAQKTQIT